VYETREVYITWRENSNTPGILAWKPDENRSHGTYMRRLDDNIKNNLNGWKWLNVFGKEM
jgi:hypothetical protein